MGVDEGRADVVSFRETDLLTMEECRQVTAEVFALRPVWEQRHRSAPFFTLGAASCVDAAAPGSSARYRVKAARVNPLLEATFGWLYAPLTTTLEAALDAPVAYEVPFGRPGFHVFLAHKLFEQPVASVHVDPQYDLLDWSRDPLRAPNFAQTISFTMPVCMPRPGAGLNTWDIRFEDFRGRGYLEALLAASKPPEYHPYQLGRIVLHSGHMVQQIAPASHITEGDPDDARITLQGHAIRCGPQWKVYW